MFPSFAYDIKHFESWVFETDEYGPWHTGPTASHRLSLPLVDEVRPTLLALVGPCWWQLTKHNEPAVEPASERNASDWLFNYANQ